MKVAEPVHFALFSSILTARLGSTPFSCVAFCIMMIEGEIRVPGESLRESSLKADRVQKLVSMGVYYVK